MRSSYYFVLLTCCIASVSAFGPSTYKCNTTVCAAPGCVCPSFSAPGGISRADAPQFIMLTNDDAVDSLVVGNWEKMLSNLTQANGCPLPVTWFTTAQGSSCALIKKLYNKGDEFADHTMTHPEIGSNAPVALREKEIYGLRTFMKSCGLPADAIKGYRSTFLLTNPATRETLKNADPPFLWDSSINLETANISNRIYPFSLDAGVPQVDCDAGYQDCNSKERYTGMFEIPVWDLMVGKDMYTMDPGSSDSGGSERDPYEVMKTNFDASYNGNKSPLPFYTHIFWFSPERIASARKFLEYANAKKNVHFVTMTQLIEWMKDPKDAAATDAWLTGICKSPGGLSANPLTPEAAPALAPGPDGAAPAPLVPLPGIVPILGPTSSPVPTPAAATPPAPKDTSGGGSSNTGGDTQPANTPSPAPSSAASVHALVSIALVLISVTLF